LLKVHRLQKSVSLANIRCTRSTVYEIYQQRTLLSLFEVRRSKSMGKLMAILGYQNSVTSELIDLKFDAGNYVSDLTAWSNFIKFSRTGACRQYGEMYTYISCTFLSYCISREPLQTKPFQRLMAINVLRAFLIMLLVFTHNIILPGLRIKQR